MSKWKLTLGPRVLEQAVYKPTLCHNLAWKLMKMQRVDTYWSSSPQETRAKLGNFIQQLLLVSL